MNHPPPQVLEPEQSERRKLLPSQVLEPEQSERRKLLPSQDLEPEQSERRKLLATISQVDLPCRISFLKPNPFHMRNFITIMAAVALILTGCATEGCIDSDALNYDITADLDDGSCVYEGEAVFWYGQEVAETKGEFATAYSFYVDGILVGSQAVSTYWTAAPDCGQNGSITVTWDLGSSTAYMAEYEVIDDAGYTVWWGNLLIEANTCTALELTL